MKRETHVGSHATCITWHCKAFYHLMSQHCKLAALGTTIFTEMGIIYSVLFKFLLKINLYNPRARMHAYMRAHTHPHSDRSCKAGTSLVLGPHYLLFQTKLH